MQTPNAYPIRFFFLDALRGLSAFTVVMFHFYINLVPFLKNPLPPEICTILRFFKYNVMVFFVLSGFVIAYSLKDTVVTGSYCVNFILRRFIRLDPPYWCIILLTLGMAFISQNFFKATTLNTVPSISVLISHFFYLQEFLEHEHFILVSWTLCYEVQFYLYFVGVLWFHQNWIKNVFSKSFQRQVFIFVLLFLPCLIPIGQKYGLIPLVPGLFTNLFYSFLSGIVICWKMEGKLDRGLFFGYTLFLGFFYALPLNMEGTYCFVIFLTIYALVKFNKLSWTGGPFLQYLGRISYSLYLVHFLVGSRAQALMLRIFGAELSLWEGFVVFSLSIFISIVAAHLFYLFVEKPCLKWSQHFKNRKECIVINSF